jgi:putative transposase
VLIIRRILARQGFENYISGKLSLFFFLPHRNEKSPETDPNALGESDLWVFNGDIENLSCLVEQGISDSDRSRIPRHSVA